MPVHPAAAAQDGERTRGPSMHHTGHRCACGFQSNMPSFCAILSTLRLKFVRAALLPLGGTCTREPDALTFVPLLTQMQVRAVRKISTRQGTHTASTASKTTRPSPTFSHMGTT